VVLGCIAAAQSAVLGGTPSVLNHPLDGCSSCRFGGGVLRVWAQWMGHGAVRISWMIDPFGACGHTARPCVQGQVDLRGVGHGAWGVEMGGGWQHTRVRGWT